jgi:hypothetical protein
MIESFLVFGFQETQVFLIGFLDDPLFIAPIAQPSEQSMRTLTSILAAIFLIAFWVGTVFLILRGADSLTAVHLQETTALALSVVLVGMAARGILTRLDRAHALAYRHAGEDSVHWVEDSAGTLTLFQAMVAALGAAWLYLTIPLLCGALFAGLALPWLILLDLQYRGPALLVGATAADLIGLVLLGWVINRSYRRATLRLMGSNAGRERRSHSPVVGGSEGAPPPTPKRLRGNNAVELSERGESLWRTGRQRRRLMLARQLLPALAGLAAVVGLSLANPVVEPGLMLKIAAAAFACIVMAEGILRLAAGMGGVVGGLRVALNLMITMPLLVLSALWRAWFVIANTTRPNLRWAGITEPAYGLHRALGSRTGLWTLVYLLVPTLLVAANTDNPADEAPWVIGCFALGTGAYWVTYALLGRLLRRLSRKPCSLVYLRVFGNANRSAFLFRKVIPHWRGIGNVLCIAAPDVSSHQLGADEAIDTLFGQVHRRFLADEMDIIGKTLDAFRASNACDEVSELHCFDDTWQEAVATMMRQNTVVLMDLRGLSTNNMGCRYEIGVLHDMVPLRGVVFLIDGATDEAFLNESLDAAWVRMDKHSPNAGKGGGPPTLFGIDRPTGSAAIQLVRALCNARASLEAFNKARASEIYAEIIAAIRLLGADVEKQKTVVGEGSPAEKVRTAGLCLMPDLGGIHAVVGNGLCSDAQHGAMSALWEEVDELRNAPMSIEAMASHEQWIRVREAAQRCLHMLGKRP